MRHVFEGTGTSHSIRVNAPVNFSVMGLSANEESQAAFVGTVRLEKKSSEGTAWTPVAQFTEAETSKFIYGTGAFYRFRCTAYTSGKIECIIAG